MLPLCDQLFVFRIEWHSYYPLWKRKGLLPTSGQYPHRCPSSHEGNAPDPPPSIKAENDNNIPQKDPQKATKVSQVAWPVTDYKPTANNVVIAFTLYYWEWHTGSVPTDVTSNRWLRFRLKTILHGACMASTAGMICYFSWYSRGKRHQ